MQLTITRDTGYYGRMRKIAIIVDGTQICSIANKESLIAEVLPGIHTIWAKIDWFETNKLSLDFGSCNTSDVNKSAKL